MIREELFMQEEHETDVARSNALTRFCIERLRKKTKKNIIQESGYQRRDLNVCESKTTTTGT
jgi:hypothetical protein